MAIEIEVSSSHERDVAASPEAAFALLADTPDSVAHFPKVSSCALTHGEDGWTWRMKKLGAGKVAIQTVYAVRYVKDAAARTISWTPIEEVGNARVWGTWRVEERPGGARLLLTNALVQTFPLPRLLRPMAQTFAARESRGLIEAYLDNLATTLAGGDGRVQAPEALAIP